MENDLLEKIITITDVSEDEQKVKLKDEKGLAYTIFKTKQDGNITVAFERWGSIVNKFVAIEIKYKESDAPQGGKYRNIVTLNWGKDLNQRVEKMSNDTQMRQAIVPKDDVQQHIKWGLAWNVASRLVAQMTGDEKIMIDTVEKYAKEIYKRVQELPVEEVKSSEQAFNDAVASGKNSMQEGDLEEFISKQQDEVDINDVPF